MNDDVETIREHLPGKLHYYEKDPFAALDRLEAENERLRENKAAYEAAAVEVERLAGWTKLLMQEKLDMAAENERLRETIAVDGEATRLERDRAEAEVERLREKDIEWSQAHYRRRVEIEALEAEVERLRGQLQVADGISEELGKVVERLRLKGSADELLLERKVEALTDEVERLRGERDIEMIRAHLPEPDEGCNAALDRLEAENERLRANEQLLSYAVKKQEAEVESLRQRLTNMRLERNEALEYVERLSRG